MAATLRRYAEVGMAHVQLVLDPITANRSSNARRSLQLSTQADRLAASPIVQTLPYVAWILLVTLAFGTYAFAFITRQLTDATSGYLRFSAVSAALLALLALATDSGLDAAVSPDLVVRPAPADLAALRGLGLAAFVLVALLWTVLLRARRAAPLLGGATLAAAGDGTRRRLARLGANRG